MVVLGLVFVVSCVYLGCCSLGWLVPSQVIGWKNESIWTLDFRPSLLRYCLLEGRELSRRTA